MNIAGVLLHALPKRIERVRGELADLPGVELHGTTPEGRLIITVEDHDAMSADRTLVALHQLEGVLSVALVYHHFEPDLVEDPARAENQETSHDAVPA